MTPLYLHGFASSPASTKARAFAAHFPGLLVPDLNDGGFERLTLSRVLAQVDALARGAGDLVLFGSSLGGYSAALWQARQRRARGLVLLAPAFDLGARWQARQRLPLGPEGLGRVFHFGLGRDVPFDEVGFLADAVLHEPYPRVDVPVLVLHGLRDDVVPIELAREFCARTPSARLVEYDAGHELGEVVPALVSEAARFVETLR